MSGPARSRYRLDCGRLLDGVGGMLLRVSIIVEGATIVAVDRSAEIPPAFRGATVIDLTRHTVLPGLIDTHLHFGIDASRLETMLIKDLATEMAIRAVVDARHTLMGGITSTRLMGTLKGFGDIALRNAIDEGLVPGPRILACGQMISIPGGHGEIVVAAPEHRLNLATAIASGPEDCRRAARELIRRGADFLKVAASGGMFSQADEVGPRQLTASEMRAIVEEGLAHGRSVAAHAQGLAGIREALTAGVHSIEHGFFLDEATVETMVRQSTFLVPTLSVPVEFLRRGTEGGLPAYAVRKARGVVEATRASFLRAYQAGVRIAMGSDNGFPDLHGKNAIEIALMAEYGMRAKDVVCASTSVAAHCLGRGDRIGRIAPGFLADIIAVPGDPLADVRVMGNAAFIMKDGVIYKSPALTSGAPT
ncbi:MAG: amidohydrolase family protein [Candidatus Rokuibacteriota bacterium]